MKIVPAYLPSKKIRLLVIGQCPGKTEAEKGRPFVGVDGLQLRTWLRGAGLSPDDEGVGWDNVFQGFNGDGTYKPTAKEQKEGFARLREMIAFLKPEVVLLVGGIAAHFQFKGGITKLNGRREAVDGVTYFCVLHPGYYRNAQIHGSRGAALAAEADILGVLKQVAAVLGGDEAAGVRLPEGFYVDQPRHLDFSDGPLAIDVETCGDTKDPRVAEFVCAATSDGAIMFDKPIIDRSAELTIWNAPYDGLVLGVWDAVWDDPKLKAHMMGEQDTTLKGMALRYLDHPMMSYPEAERLNGLPEYCLDDAMTTAQINPIIEECMDESVLDLYNTLEKPLLPLWTKMSMEGSFYLDHEALTKYQWELAEKVGGLLLEVEDMLPRGREVKACSVCGIRAGDKQPGQRCEGGANHRWGVEFWADEPVNLNSPVHQLLPALQDLGIPVVSTGAGELELYADRYPVLKGLLDYREANKELTTYIDPWCTVPLGERLGAIWNPHGTWTMRVSSRGPNVMNIPNKCGKECDEMMHGSDCRDLWRFFHAGEEHDLLSFDHAQLEVRLGAHLSEDPAMIAACQSEDVHGSFQKMLGLEDRRLTKIFVFGAMYGGSAEAFDRAATKFGVKLGYSTIMEGMTLIKTRFARYFQWAAETSELRVVPGLFGMRHVVPPGEEYHRGLEAVNAGPQGGGGLVTKWGMLALHRAGYEVVCQVHDSITVRVRKKNTKAAKKEVPRIMEEAIPHPLLVPLKVELK